MNRALSAMFANKEMRNTTIDTTTRSTLRMMFRYTIVTEEKR